MTEYKLLENELKAEDFIKLKVSAGFISNHAGETVVIGTHGTALSAIL